MMVFADSRQSCCYIFAFPIFLLLFSLRDVMLVNVSFERTNLQPLLETSPPPFEILAGGITQPLLGIRS